MAVEGIEVYRQQILAESKRQVDLAVRAEKQKIGLAMWQQVDRLTPVDEGEARKGWHFSSGEKTNENREPAGGDALSELVQITTEAGAGKAIYLQNNVGHIRVLDEGLFEPPNPGPSKDPREGRKGQILVRSGFSVQAPRGITADAIDAVASAFNLQRTKDGA